MTRILIIGGGIGGLTAAIALRQKGFDAHVYEAAPELQPVGKGIWVPTNAMLVLDRLGLSDAVNQAGWALERIKISEGDGPALLDVDLRRIQQKFGHTTISIHRATLVRILAAALPAEVLHLGHRFTGFTQEENGIVAAFAGQAAVRGDLLIGADGIRSSVREQLQPGVPLRYSGQTCFRGIGRLELPPGLERTCWEVWGGTARFGFSVIGSDQVYWFAPCTAPVDAPQQTGEALLRELRERYRAFPEPIPAIVRHTPAEEIMRTDLYDFAPLPWWQQGWVVLLGDAAHAMTPNLRQGGAQAIEDAWFLADRLASCPTIGEALEEYEQYRMPKVRWIARTAWQLGQLAHLENPWLRRLRNLVMRMTPTWVNERQQERVIRLDT